MRQRVKRQRLLLLQHLPNNLHHRLAAFRATLFVHNLCTFIAIIIDVMLARCVNGLPNANVVFGLGSRPSVMMPS